MDMDVHMLLCMFERLVVNDATVLVTEYDLETIANADYLIDIGPGGGEDGGCIMDTGTPVEAAAYPQSVTEKN